MVKLIWREREGGKMDGQREGGWRDRGKEDGGREDGQREGGWM